MIRFVLRVAGLAASAVCLLLVQRPFTSASQELLQNGGFEAGLSGWATASAVLGVCAAHSGVAALSMAPAAAGPSTAQQLVPGVAGGLGPYTVGGYAKLGGGSPQARVTISWLDADGAKLLDRQESVALPSSYALFSFATSSAPAGAVSLSVRLAVTGTGSACFDDLSLDGPAQVTPAPPPAASRSATAPPAASTSLPSVTPSPRPPTPARTATAPVSEAIANGGFEGSVEPWQGYGAELRLVTAPVNSGRGAGMLISTTSSTKWAYQAIQVAPERVYEFSGFVMPGPGVSESYLRISWFESADGIGRAIGSTDSTERLAGAGAVFVPLSTGPVQAPPNANSARARVMLAPAGTGPAVIFLDDLVFGRSTLGPKAEATLIAPTAEEDGADGAPALTTRSSPAATGGAVRAPVAGPASRAGRGATPANQGVTVDGGMPSGEHAVGRKAASQALSPLLYALGGSALTGVGLAFALWYSRRVRRDD